MLKDCRVLIAEDEALIACDLACCVEAAHGQVIGPFATVKKGMAFLVDGDVQAAILDVRLADGEVTPVALHLLEHKKVVVFHTASDIPAEVVRRHGELPLCKKPMLAERVILHLARTLGQST